MFPPLQIYGLLRIKVFWALLHWIDPVTLHLQKAAIACRRFRGRRTYDAIAAEIEQIHSSFALCGKITATVTDNGSNFVKAFRMFQADDEADNDVDEVIFTEFFTSFTR